MILISTRFSVGRSGATARHGIRQRAADCRAPLDTALARTPRPA
jgi:hypothetical protein